MVKLRARTERSLKTLLKELNNQQLREAVDFILFLRSRSIIDSTQAYFWTKKWQGMEQRVERDKRQKRFVGDGTVESLLRALKA